MPGEARPPLPFTLEQIKLSLYSEILGRVIVDDCVLSADERAAAEAQIGARIEAFQLAQIAIDNQMAGKDEVAWFTDTKIQALLLAAQVELGPDAS